MKTNIVVSAVRVNGYWYLRVKYDENNCRVRYQQSTGLKIDQSYRKVEQARRRVLAELLRNQPHGRAVRKSGTSHQSCAISRYPNG